MPLICRERLARIQRVLNQNAGALNVRDFARSYHVYEWEIEQAAALGWIQIETKKPRTGRPSRIVKIVSKPEGAKLPPYRWQIEKPIRIRHWNFAFHSVYSAIRGGSSFLWRIPPYTDAYLQAFPAAKSRRAAGRCRCCRRLQRAAGAGGAGRKKSCQGAAAAALQRPLWPLLLLLQRRAAQWQ